MTSFSLLLTHALAENNHVFSVEMQQKLVAYLVLLQKWNKVFNLTAIHDPKEMVYVHILDSLSIIPYLHGIVMLDVGSGAGLPGIPLAITQPNQEWTLLDKNGKKTRFLTQVIAELGLKNVSVVQAHCEEYHSHRCFDSIVSRALSDLSTMLVKTEHLLCPKGVWLAMKGDKISAELNEIPSQYQIEAVHQIKIKGWIKQ